ncbi:hypothetical protein PMZ80_003749 [Knufia obscura]|uniref:chitin synthase n=1 Tax=Knufia obscura TaxID=1635080 RepID=A0ABR0RVL2_9EURO|nr:hypothetical protein PMZ80_003749 [Knufia obscura]
MGSAQSHATWRVVDIVYISIVGPIMICALIEWFLWISAFCYCLCKAFKKADHWSTRLLVVFMLLLFIILRVAFLPVMAVTLPLPRQARGFLPVIVETYFQWFAFFTFAVLLTIPWLVCVYRIVVYPFGRKKQIKHELDEITAPKVVVAMPVYKEPPESLFKALDSVVSCDYPAACIHVFVSFDGDEVDELYLQLLRRLGIPISLEDYPQSIDVCYNGARVTVSRFPHGGKRHCQKATFRLIDKIYKRYLQKKDDLFILFIDSDCILDNVCIQNFMYEMELKPGSTGQMLAMTGVITSCTQKNSFITLLQDMEYIHGQMYERSVESGCGAVTCLPGALTILRFSAFRNMARFYFSDRAEQCEDLFDYGKTHLGEDRWLTHLFMIGAQKRYQIQMCTSAFCKTEAVQTFYSLLKQRRRWFLGFITNEVCMLTDIRLWRKYPLLCLIRFMQNTIRTTALLFLVMVISVASTAEYFDNLPWQFIGVSLGLNWVMMIYFAFKLGRWKPVLYPIMFLMNPIMNWIYMVHGIFTAGQRTWGGPRADAAAANAKITPQQAIEQAAEAGDDLNIVPETFKPAIEARKHRLQHSTLQPTSSAENRFASAEEYGIGLHHRLSLSRGRTETDRDVEKEAYGHMDDLAEMSDSDALSIHTPRRVEELHRSAGTS